MAEQPGEVAIGAQRAWPGFSTRAAGIHGSAIDSSTSLLQSQAHDIVRMAMGSPSPEAVPSAEFAAVASEIFDPGAHDVFDYGPTEGEANLRTLLLEFLERQHGVAPAPEELLITSGGMQGLDLTCKLFVDPGDVVAVEAPTYTNGTDVITGYGGAVLEIPTDGEGLDVAALRDLGAAQPPKVIYTIPNFQNPSGATMSLPRRLELVELAERWGALILEDDPYRQLRFSGEDLPSLQHLAAGNVRVVGVHTFSKILAPGLRVGWVTADPETIGRMIDAKQGLDTCTNVPMQRLVARFMSRGLLDAHILRLRPEYRERRDRMQQRLEEHFTDLGATWTHPEGGFFLWLTLPEEVDTEALFAVALAEGVAFIPGCAFSVSRRFGNALRLAFSVCSGERTDLGISRLRTAVDRHLAEA
ncbi:MAG TPA: PLP-dependent aminotransferase family protein [Solirubrobacteraceae bacterium]|jgi:2-aminoadipate transaminase|nr:PLP-dependent aminotransferase family protein [Solirubrobacteraceae bacterium]